MVRAFVGDSTITRRRGGRSSAGVSWSPSSEAGTLYGRPPRRQGKARRRVRALGDARGGRSSDGPAVADRPAERDLVGVLEVAADGQAVGDAADREGQVVELPGEVEGRGLALDGRRRGQHDPAVAGQAVHEVVDGELIGAHTVRSAEGAVQDVVEAPVLAAALDRQ